MYEKFVLGRIEAEKEIVNGFWHQVLSGDKHLKEAVVESGLSDFTKNYIVSDLADADDKDEIYSRIEKSNKLYFNYAIRPKWTMLIFLFGSFESRPPNEIMRKLNTFPFYNFYSEAINDFIKENQQIFITKTEISNIIDATHKALYEKLVTDINNVKIKNFFLQIFRLKYDEEKYNLESTIPYSFVKIFLQDKSYPDVEKKFSVIKGIGEEYEISLKDIIKVLTDKYGTPEKKDEPVIKPEPVKPEIKKPAEAGKESPVKNESVAGEISKQEKPVKIDLVSPEKDKVTVAPDLNKQDLKKPGAKIPLVTKDNSIEKQVKSKPETTIKPDKIYSADLLKADTVEKINSDKHADNSNGYDIKDLFTEKQLEKISDKVYKSDLIHREKSFDKLNHLKTWSEATNHLKDVFRINEVDLYNKDVISFIDILNEYYKNRE